MVADARAPASLVLGMIVLGRAPSVARNSGREETCDCLNGAITSDFTEAGVGELKDELGQAGIRNPAPRTKPRVLPLHQLTRG